MNTIWPQLYVSPYSKDIVLMTTNYPVPIGFICSWSQVNPLGGYTGFTPKSLRDFVGPNRIIAQDHFLKGGEDPAHIEDLPYDYVHLHTTDLELIKQCVDHYPNMKWELGTGEDPVPNYIEYMYRLLDIVPVDRIAYLSFPTGCKIRSCYNVNTVDEDLCENMHAWGLPLKGHNSDYTNREVLWKSAKYLQAWNIAPQLGVIATRTYVTYARTHGLNIADWEDAVINGKRWKRWGGIAQAVELGGQYHFNELPEDVSKGAYPFVKAALYRLFDFFFEATNR